MFVSYSVGNSGYGYMCFYDGTSIFCIHKFLISRILEPVRIIFASNYSTRLKNKIYMCTSGKYRLECYDKPIRDADEIGTLYCYLYDKYGFTNILGYY